MRFSVLASGSKANCTFIEWDGGAILVDCGLSARQVCLRLEELGLSVDNLKAIIITHEHRDHTAGASVLSRKLQIPVFANRATSEFIENVYAFDFFNTGVSFTIGSLEVYPFQTVHDAVDPVGITLTFDDFKVGIATDMGRVTPLVLNALSGCQGLLVEANYDPESLRTCEYPWQLKQRITSSHGHLSNFEAGELLLQLLHNELQHVVLGHLSENSNNPEIALETVLASSGIADIAQVICASVAQPTPILELKKFADPVQAIDIVAAAS